ncbi:MAG: hypothetical protein LC674_03895, partial [Actinobacteria bacterium]|nr:hypothetical protein [Actinomycetota bacterium]
MRDGKVRVGGKEANLPKMLKVHYKAEVSYRPLRRSVKRAAAREMLGHGLLVVDKSALLVYEKVHP